MIDLLFWGKRGTDVSSKRTRRSCAITSKKSGKSRIPLRLTISLRKSYRRYRSPTTAPLTREGQKQLLTGFRTAFPDIQLTVEEMIAEDDKIAFRSTMRGTHQGDFLGIAATGHRVTVSLLDVIRIEDGKFIEQWGGPDTHDLLRQIQQS